MLLKRMLKYITCIILFISTMLFVLPTTSLYFYGLPLIYVCFIVPYVIGKILFPNRFVNNTGYGYKIPIVLFLALLLLEFNLFSGIFRANALDMLQSGNEIKILNPLNYLFELNIYFWLEIVFVRIGIYALMIYTWLYKAKENKNILNGNNDVKGTNNIVGIIVTLLWFFVLSGYFIFKFLLFMGDENLTYSLAICLLTMETCLFSLLISIFYPLRSKAFIMFGISLVIYLIISVYMDYFTDYRQANTCLDTQRGVWDSHERRCRFDCLQWSQTTGCIPLPENDKEE